MALMMDDMDLLSVPALDDGIAEKEQDLRLIQSARRQIVHKHIAKEREKILEPGAFRALSQFLLESGEISYDTFVALRQTLPEMHSKYFTSKVFLALAPNPTSLTISSERFVKFIDQDLEMKRILLDLMEYSLLNANPSYITAAQLQAYIGRRIPDIDPDQQMVESFHEFYTCTAVQRFLFHVDHRNSNSLSIAALMRSEVLAEFLDLLASQAQQTSLRELDQEQSEEMYLLRDKMDLNWFSATNAVNIYTTFLNLDVDQNGLLNLDEVSEFNGFSANGLHFTRCAWQRIFEELVLFAPFELDYRGFVHLVLALDDIALAEEAERGPEGSTKGMAGMRFFWNVIDFNRSDGLSATKIKHFYADIEEYMILAGQIIPEAQGIITEIYDMLAHKPHPHTKGPGFKQLLASKRTALAVMMLLDINSFWRYENRENPSASPTPPPPQWQEPKDSGKAPEVFEYEMDSPPKAAPPPQPLVPQPIAQDALEKEKIKSALAKMTEIVYDDEGDEYDF